MITHSLGSITSNEALLTIRCDGVFIGNIDPIVMEAEHYHENYARNGKNEKLEKRSERGIMGVNDKSSHKMKMCKIEFTKEKWNSSIHSIESGEKQNRMMMT